VKKAVEFAGLQLGKRSGERGGFGIERGKEGV
jgi:hypothetical protein